MKIRARISAKLKDQSGASITYALLLFLVCAVVSSVVITAATAASGRMSKSVETDQRYYAVTSAAELIKDLFDGVKVTTQTKIVGKSGTPTMDSDSTYPMVTKPAGSELEPEANYEILKSAARQFAGMPSSSDSFPKNLEVKLNSDSAKNADINVKYNTSDAGSARLIFKISSYDSENTKDIYTLYLAFDADIDQIVDKKTKDTYVEAEHKVMPVVTTTTTTIMTWSLTSMGTADPEG